MRNLYYITDIGYYFPYVHSGLYRLERILIPKWILDEMRNTTFRPSPRHLFPWLDITIIRGSIHILKYAFGNEWILISRDGLRAYNKKYDIIKGIFKGWIKYEI